MCLYELYESDPKSSINLSFFRQQCAGSPTYAEECSEDPNNAQFWLEYLDLSGIEAPGHSQ
jgi:hypothetical protein